MCIRDSLKTEYIKYVQNERVVKKRILRFDLPAYTGIILKKVPYKYTDDSQMKKMCIRDRPHNPRRGSKSHTIITLRVESRIFTRIE